MIELRSQLIEGCWEFTVSDEGPGLPDYALQRAFERFYSLPRPDGAPRSSGLGLSFVREVAQMHGGQISLENRDNGGAIARFVVPVKPPPHSP